MVIFAWFLLNVFGVGVSCRFLYSFVGYLYVNCSGSITSVREERANLSAIVYLYFSHEPSSLFHHSVLVDLNVSMMMH